MPTAGHLFGGQPRGLLLGGHLGAQAHRVVEWHLFARVAIFALALSAAEQRGRLRGASQHHPKLLGGGIEQGAQPLEQSLGTVLARIRPASSALSTSTPSPSPRATSRILLRCA